MATASALINKPAHQFYPETYGAVGDDTTDDTAAINAAIQAAFAYANSSGGYYAEVVFRPCTYKVAGAYSHTYYGNSQLPIPYQSMTSNKVTLVLKCAVDSSALPTWRQTTVQKSGAVLRSTGAGGAVDATYGVPNVIGGPAFQQGFGQSGVAPAVGPDAGNMNTWNNVMVVIDGISVVVPSPANQTAVYLLTCAEAVVESLSVFSNASTAGTTPYALATNTAAYGLMMPRDYNNANNRIGTYSCEGMYTGLNLGEHTIANTIRVVYCRTGVEVTNTAHYALVHYACIERCVVGIWSDGRADFMMADFENNSATGTNDGGAFSTVYYVQSGTSAAGTVRYFTFDSTSTLIDPNLLAIADGAALRVLDGRLRQGFYDTPPAVPASTGFVLNPYFRDCQVRITGGTVSKVEVWTPGTTSTYRTVATTTDVTVFVPAHAYIKPTYTAAPTWHWCLTSATL